MYRAAYDAYFLASNKVERIYNVFHAKNKSAAQKFAEEYIKLLADVETIKGTPILINVKRHLGNSVSVEDVVEFPIS